MSRTKDYYIVIDTETCPIDRTIKGCDKNNGFVYDCGWAVIDRNGNIYKTTSFVNSDIFFEKTLMTSAYYKSKIPNYWNDIKNGSRVLTSLYSIRQALNSDIKEYNVKRIYAFNHPFDVAVLNRTVRWVTKSKIRYFYPYGIEIHDIMKSARQILAKSRNYKKFCEDNNYLTKNNKPNCKAETVYRYITKNNDFIESHTGLEDVLIEAEILKTCFKRHKKMNTKIY